MEHFGSNACCVLFQRSAYSAALYTVSKVPSQVTASSKPMSVGYGPPLCCQPARPRACEVFCLFLGPPILVLSGRRTRGWSFLSGQA